MFEGAPGWITKYMSINRFEDILRNLSYTDKNVPGYNGKSFHMCQMEDVCVIDEIIQEWISYYTCPAWIFVGRKPHPFGNESHTIACELSKIMWFAEIVEGV